MYAPAIGRTSLTERTNLAGREVFLGRRRGPLAVLPFAGPAVIASIAYMDPGNFATNIQAGAGYGYELLWVALSANLVAMLFQALSAKIGIATGRNLAELCGEHFAPPVVYTMWLASEIAAMATELAELLGASLGLDIAVRHTLACQHAPRRDRHLCGAALTALGFPVSRNPDRLLCRRDHRQLPDRAGDRAAALGRCRSWCARSASAWGGQHHVGRGHCRRHGHAARDIPSLRLDAGAFVLRECGSSGARPSSCRIARYCWRSGSPAWSIWQ